MKFMKPQNIDASYTTMYNNADVVEEAEADGGSSYDDEIKYDDEITQNEYDEEQYEDVLEEDGADITVEEAFPPPPLQQIEEGETPEFQYVQGMPSSNESWSERVTNFKTSKDNQNNNQMIVSSKLIVPHPPLTIQQQQPLSQQGEQMLIEKQQVMTTTQFDTNKNELEGIDTFVAEGQQGDTNVDEGASLEAVAMPEKKMEDEDEREGGEDEEEREEEGEGGVEEVVEKEVELKEQGDDEEEMIKEEGGEEEELHEQQEEEVVEHEEEEVEQEEQQQQQDNLKVEATPNDAPNDTLALDPPCNTMKKWHPNKEFNQCSNSMDVPQAWIDDENFQTLYFYDTLVECCQKFFRGNDKECEGVDVCAEDLNNKVVEEEEEEVKGGIALERQADGELEDEVPDEETEGQSGDDPNGSTQEGVADEEGVEKEEESGKDEEEEEGEVSDESTNESSSTEGQGVQIDESNEKTNWEGFDEDMPRQQNNVMHEPEQPTSSSSVEAHDLSEARNKNDYKGDGFGAMKYKLLRGKGEGGKVAV